MGKYHDRFDYENAELDILDAGGDPDYLDYNNPAKRDKFMRDMGMDPKKYGSRWEEPKDPPKKDPFDPLLFQDDSDDYVPKKKEEVRRNVGDDPRIFTTGITKVVDEANHALIQMDIDSGLYTENEILKKYNLKITDLRNNYFLHKLKSDEEK